MVWVVFAVLTGVTLLAVLWPLLRARQGAAPEASEKTFYLSAIAGIERDLERSLISASDAEAARSEAARRFIASARTSLPPDVSPARTRLAALASLIIIPALALGLYVYLGAPDYLDQPLEARLDAAPGEMDVNAALAKIEKHLADHPDDARGWEIIAPVYMKLGRATDAAEAFRHQIRILGPSADRLSAFGEALAFAANGNVTPQARMAFEAALKDDTSHPRARFFVALADEQAGARDAALAGYSRLLADAPADAPWAEMVRERIDRLGGAAVPKSQAQEIVAMPVEARETAIRGMVAGLAARLAQNGEDAEGWLRLVRSYTMLGEPEKARAALRDARKVLTANPPAMDQLDTLARELGLGG